MSKKRKAEHKIYLKLRKEFLAANPKCQMHTCSRMADDVHHVFGRGCNYLRVGTWKALCRVCHEWVGRNPVMARELGLLAPKGQWMVSVDCEAA